MVQKGSKLQHLIFENFEHIIAQIKNPFLHGEVSIVIIKIYYPLAALHVVKIDQAVVPERSEERCCLIQYILIALYIVVKLLPH